MESYRKVRLACRDGMSERAAARYFGISRESVRTMIEFSVPPGYIRTALVRRPKLDGFTGLIDEWLRRDRDDDHRKQRHTAKRIFERLRDEDGCTDGYTIVKDYVREHHRRRREMYVPLVHPPGHGQADFGEAWVYIGGVKRKVHFFAFDLPQSDASYVRAYPAATAEAWVDGHVHAFSFFGTVPSSMLPDDVPRNIIDDHQLRTPPEELERANMRCRPVGKGLRPGRLGEGVARRPEHRDEHLCLALLAGLAVDHRDRVPGVVHEHLLARTVLLAHYHVELRRPRSVLLAEPAVLQPLGVGRLVLLPQQRERRKRYELPTFLSLT